MNKWTYENTNKDIQINKQTNRDMQAHLLTNKQTGTYRHTY